MANLGFSELMLIFGIVVLLFGAKKIPEIAEGLGKGIKKFKDTQKEVDPPASIPNKSENNKE